MSRHTIAAVFGELDFRTADEASLETFLAVSAASPYQQQLREYTESLSGRGARGPARAARDEQLVAAGADEVPRRL